MKKMRMTQVTRAEDLTPHMRRIVLQGDDLNDFPTGVEGAHFKAIFPQPGQTLPRLGTYLGFKKWMRSYTIRAFNNQNKELTVDFAVNDHEGLAANWAKNAQHGDYLGVAGPGETKYTNYHADWHVLVADLTALPAAAAIMERLPKTASGVACIQVPTEDDKQNIAAPEGVQINWIINSDPGKKALLQGVKSLQWRNGIPAVFIAAESNQMKAVQQYIKTKPGYSREQTYASGYWKSRSWGPVHALVCNNPGLAAIARYDRDQRNSPGAGFHRHGWAGDD